MKKPVWFILAQDGKAHFPEFFFVQASRFEGRKIKTFCGIVTIKFWEQTIYIPTCAACKEKLEKMGSHDPKEIKLP